MGSMSGITWDKLPIVFGVTLGGSAILFGISRFLDAFLPVPSRFERPDVVVPRDRGEAEARFRALLGDAQTAPRQGPS